MIRVGLTRIAVDRYFDHLVHELAVVTKFVENNSEELTLQSMKHLRNDDDEAGVQFLSRIEFPKVASVVGYERKILVDDPGHQVPIGLAAQAQPIDMKAIVAELLRHGHEGCVEAFIDGAGTRAARNRTVRTNRAGTSCGAKSRTR